MRHLVRGSVAARLSLLGLLGTAPLGCGRPSCEAGFTERGGLCYAQPAPDTQATDSGASAIDTAPAGAIDTAPADGETDPGWSLDPVITCPEPRASVSYYDASSQLTTAESFSQHVNHGMVAAWEQGGDWVLAWQDPDGVRWASATGKEGVEGRIAGDEIGRFTVRDIDGDGVLDLLKWSTTIDIYWSFGTGDQLRQTLADHSEQMGLGQECGWLGMDLGDLDGDGLLDIFVPSGVDTCESGPIPMVLQQTAPRRFELRDVAMGGASIGQTFDAYFLDLSGDGATDIYACNDFGWDIEPNQVLANDGAGGLALSSLQGAQVATNCMSTSFGDVDGDGLLDMYVAGTSYQYLLLDTAAGYVDYRAAEGLDALTEPEMPWGTALADYDNDGALELFVNSSVHLYQETQRFPMHLYQRQSAGGWVDVGQSVGLAAEASARGLLVRDLNGDGVPDVLAGDFERPPWLFLSEGCTAASWLEVRAPAGAIVRVMAGGRVRVAQATGRPGFGGVGPASAHFGLGDAGEVEWVTAEIPWRGQVRLQGPFEARRTIRWAAM